MRTVTAHAGVLRLVAPEGGAEEEAPAAGEPATDGGADPSRLVANGEKGKLDASAADRLIRSLRGVLAGRPSSDGGAESPPAGVAGATVFRTGLPAWDELAPGGAFGLGVVHELLYPPKAPAPRTVAALLAVAAAAARGGWVAWSDPAGTLYPPGLERLGLPMARLLLLRPAAPADEAWAAAECLRCRGVAATVVEPSRLSRVQARRLQLAAERGGGAGVFLRPRRSATDYAAATRWLVRPAPGGRTVQRWAVELLHGHGGRVGQAVILEVSRDVVRRTTGEPHPNEAHPVRATPAVGDRAGGAAGTSNRATA